MIEVDVARGSAAHQAPVGPAILGGSRLESVVQGRPDGRLVTSLSELAGSSTLAALHDARRTVTELDITDYRTSVDVRSIGSETPFEILWTPATAIVDLMLDWDLLELEITGDELAEWLDVDVSVALRAVDRLAGFAGVAVHERGGEDVLRLRIDVDGCPLTSELCSRPATA